MSWISVVGGVAARASGVLVRPAALFHRMLWPTSQNRSFSLLPWFSLLSFCCIVLLSAALAAVLSRFMTDAMIERDAALSSQFFDSFAHVKPAWTYFEGPQDLPADPSLVTFLDELFDRLMIESDIIRANVYAQNRTIMWSSSPDFVGASDDSNIELDEALAGRISVELGAVGTRGRAEFVEFSSELEGAAWVEYFIPIWSRDRRTVVGVVQIYRLTEDLLRAIGRGRQLIWATTLGGGALLYLALFGLVRRAARVIQAQEDKLVEAESMAAIGEMASAVAHGIRNPLASIRSSAELIIMRDGSGTSNSARDIISSVDRLNEWVRTLLYKAHGAINTSTTADLNAISHSCLAGLSTTLRDHHVALTLELGEALPLVRGDPVMLGHVLNSLLANALEAMPGGGKLHVATSLNMQKRLVEVRISDSGHGIAEDARRPLVTGKVGGLGLGLMLSRRIVERLGGVVDLTSNHGGGTVATIRLPAMR
jgi:signal transduction histidine kinase